MTTELAKKFPIDSPDHGEHHRSEHLQDFDHWWNEVFSPEEREYMVSVCPSLSQRDVLRFQSPASFLISVISWFKSRKDRTIGKRLVQRAFQEACAASNEQDLHFVYQQIIELHYPDRDNDPTALELVIRACESQIALATIMAPILEQQWGIIPEHTGYRQLAIIREKQGRYEDSIRLGKEALKGHWDDENCKKRIARCEAKLRKLKAIKASK